MIHYKIGTGFDMELIDKVAYLNKKYMARAKVTEFYGSLAFDHELAARPKFRLPDKGVDDLEAFTKAAAEIGVEVNYTMNSIMPFGSKRAMACHAVKIMEWIHTLEDIGVKLLTISSPMLLELIKQNGGTSLRIELSTIAHIDALTQILYYHDVYGVKKICGNLMKNRDFEFIRKAVELCKELGMQYELMANEFCGVGTSDYATHCVYRDNCYICHATNHNFVDTKLMHNYPMDMCTAGRNANHANWLRSNFIRPEDVYTYYTDTGCDRFKLTGRNGSLEFQSRVLEAYMSGEFAGDLLELWKPLETIKETNEGESVAYKTVPNKALDGFIEHWRGGFRCADELCGHTCRYCQKWYDDIIEKENEYSEE